MKLTVYNSQINVIFETLIRFFTTVCNASVQILQNECPYIIGIVISNVELRNDNTEHT
jgi:hypothetical protein